MILQASNVSKTYGKTRKKGAFTLNIDSFEVPEGSFTAILGPNGSGKSTFLKLILNLRFVDQGSIKLFGESHTQKAARRKVSYLPENFSFPENFTVRQMLHLFQELDPDDDNNDDEQIEQLAKAFNVDYLDKRMKDLSKGMLQTAALMHTFLGHRQFYILDEPFNGLDAVQKKSIMDYIFDRQRRENISILITTHILSDIEKTCDNLHLIRDGAIIDSATKEEINNQFGSVEQYYLSYFESKNSVQS
ncbi:MAG TPA: ABC transporter ATP-binding protein [Balneolaceae bacterium]|nr:ABC transporter ATP-binding protein [Balneolaceae bacterium]